MMIGIVTGAEEELAHFELIGVPPQVDALARSTSTVSVDSSIPSRFRTTPRGRTHLFGGRAVERRFRVRLDELRNDAEVPPNLLRGVVPRLESFLRPFADLLRSAQQRTNTRHYVQGLL